MTLELEIDFLFGCGSSSPGAHHGESCSSPFPSFPLFLSGPFGFEIITNIEHVFDRVLVLDISLLASFLSKNRSTREQYLSSTHSSSNIPSIGCGYRSL